MEIALLLIVIIFAFLPGIFWLIFFSMEGVHPEPKKKIASIFILGIVISIPIIFLQVAGRDMSTLIFPDGLPSTLLGYIVIFILIILYPAFVEEVLKFLATAFSLKGTDLIRTPVDAMIFMTAAGLGLATFENVSIAISIVSSLEEINIREIIDVTMLRFIGATLLHALASALIGYYWAKSKLLGTKGLLYTGIIMASFIHGIFNYLIITSESMNYLIVPSLFLVVVAFFIFRDFDELRLSFVEFPAHNK